MSLDKRNLWFTFALAFLAFLSAPILLPAWHLSYLVPFIVIAFYQKKQVTCLWLSFFCGLLADLLSDDLRFGSHAVAYSLTTALLYQQKQNFFADIAGTLPVMTFFFVEISSLSRQVILYLFGSDLSFSAEMFLTDFLYMPFYDALYSFLLFQVPYLLFGKKQRKGSDFFHR